MIVLRPLTILVGPNGAGKTTIVNTIADIFDGRVIRFNENLLPGASSGVRELYPLVFYLRYMATKGDLLVIENACMCLHPRLQVRMIEIFCMMANAGLNILLTTHSPYLLDHLQNLITGSRNPQKNKDYLFLKCKEAFISAENVGIYLIENGTAQNILSVEGEIDWQTFGEISDRISQIFYDIGGYDDDTTQT